MLRVASFVLVLLAALALQPAPAGAVSDSIAPGDAIFIDGSSICTLNFVFDGVGAQAGKVYIGTAAHCINGNWDARFDHVEGGMVVGAQLASVDTPNFATVAWLGDYSDSVNGGEAVENEIPGTQLDFALLEFKPAYAPLAQAEVRGHPGMPRGHTLAPQTALGDILLHSGHGIAWSETQATRESHHGTLWSDTSTSYLEVGTTVPGDSGGPILHQKTGKALGVVSLISIGIVPPIQDSGPTIQGVLAELAAHGITVQVRNATA